LPDPDISQSIPGLLECLAKVKNEEGPDIGNCWRSVRSAAGQTSSGIEQELVRQIHLLDTAEVDMKYYYDKAEKNSQA
jgi:hypothetical protein